MKRILIATSNAGKLRDFAGAAAQHGIEIGAIPNFTSLPTPVEDGNTFEENALKKAEQYSLAVPGEIVVADDSGLEIDALDGDPGVHSARYAAPELHGKEPHEADTNTDDQANNARVIRELNDVPFEKMRLAEATDSVTIRCFTFPQSRRLSPNSMLRRRRTTAIAGPHSGFS
jgi:XTP/dITP diphosphohydrolase